MTEVPSSSLPATHVWRKFPFGCDWTYDGPNDAGEWKFCNHPEARTVPSEDGRTRQLCGAHRSLAVNDRGLVQAPACPDRGLHAQTNGQWFDHDPGGRWAMCGGCGRIWDDALVTDRTPVPSGRCPYEDSGHSDYVSLLDFDGEWSVMSRYEFQTTGAESEYGPAEPAYPVFNLEGYRGHYLTADFLSEAADLLGQVQSGVVIGEGLVDLSLPENFPLRDRVDEMRGEADETWARYHAHNDPHVTSLPDPQMYADYGSECPVGDDGYPDCSCGQGIHDLADDMESLLVDLGFVCEWNDGVYVYWVGVS